MAPLRNMGRSSFAILRLVSVTEASLRNRSSERKLGSAGRSRARVNGVGVAVSRVRFRHEPIERALSGLSPQLPSRYCRLMPVLGGKAAGLPLGSFSKKADVH